MGAGGITGAADVVVVTELTTDVVVALDIVLPDGVGGAGGVGTDGCKNYNSHSQ